MSLLLSFVLRDVDVGDDPALGDVSDAFQLQFAAIALHCGCDARPMASDSSPNEAEPAHS